MASWNLLNLLASGQSVGQPEGQASPHHDLILQVTRGMPFNPTTEMDLRLWELAQAIRRDPASLAALQNGEARALADSYLAGGLPPVARQVIGDFLKVYGGRGLGEIDLGRPRWSDDPTHVFEMLLSFLQIENAAQAPDVVFARGAQSAQKAIDQLAVSVRKSRHGWLRSRLVRFLAGRARQLLGARESPKFFAVRMMWIIQRALKASGEELVQAGELDQPDDLFYLTFAELKAFAAREDKNWRGLVRSRRENYQRELLRRQVPRLLLSDGRAFYAGIQSGEARRDVIHGSPVSPGGAQGRVRVVRDPRQAGLQPGEILVCPGTDPSWTPLFLSAAGLVMETGGMMTHGAVVAREYGIPAIVGVDRATERLHTGQLIRMDGSSGEIILSPENQSTDATD
jgi:pyruvate,water dikinase